ncbi:MAG: lamin tail domain-containing protein [Candidatus Poribacteria bacterium]|nr:lamin tail domain-containing protein [Candidatus Poribacteria bacterium]
MRLSNKSTFSLVCLVLLFAFATVPAMANTMSATWTDEDLDANTDGTQSGWIVRVIYATIPDATFVPTLTPGDSNVASVGTPEKIAGGTFDINVALSTANQTADADVTVDDTDPQFASRRVTLMNGKDLAQIHIKQPQLESITASKSTNGGSEIGATINFSVGAMLSKYGSPPDGLRGSDIQFTGGTGVVTDIEQHRHAYDVKMRIISVTDPASPVVTISLVPTATTAGIFRYTADASTVNNSAMVVYDTVAPAIGDITFTRINSNRVLDISSVSEAFDINVAGIMDTPAGDFPAGVADLALSVKFDVTPKARGADVSNQGKIVGTDNTYAATITPKANTTTATWDPTPITITVTVKDMAGNETTRTAPVVTIAARPGVPATAAMIPTKALGSTTAGATLTITFDKDPGTVMDGTTTLAGTGTTRMLMVPATQGAGDYSVDLTWAHSGSGTVTYTIPAGPMLDPNASPAIPIPAGKFVVVVRATSSGVGTLLTAYDPNIMLVAWPTMPDLYDTFDTSAVHGGGALILKQAGDSSAEGYVALNPGTVGISEIMSAIDESKLGNADTRKADQWIELHNLNTTDATVTLSWKTGAKAIADDTSINGDLAAPYLDVVTNVFNDRPGNTYDLNGSQVGYWILPSKNGNPGAGTNFVSAARTGDFNLTSQHQGKHNKRYTKTANGNSANSRDGRNRGHWASSTTPYARRTVPLGVGLGNVVYENHGTPGRVNTFSPERATTRDTRTDVPASPIIINEIANRDDEHNQYEWIELKNVSNGPINLNNYQISILTGVDKDEPFIFLPNNNDTVIPAGGVLLLVDSDPFGDPDHPLAVGWKIGKNPEDQVPGLASIGINATSKEGRYLVIPFGGKNNKFVTGLPDTTDFILIVRRPDKGKPHNNNHGHGGEGRSELGAADLDLINDIAGYAGTLTKNGYTNAVSKTDLWPLKEQRTGALISDRNRLSVNTVHYRARNGRNGLAGVGTTHNDRNEGQVAYQHAGYTGIGYKRQASNSAMHGGTPGYDNGARKGRVSDLAMDKLVISEIMLYQGPEDARTTLPQWIEIYNPSPHPVGLGGWRLIIENPRDPIRTINLGGGSVKTILSEQTILVVSGSARDIGSDSLPSSAVFPPTRVYNVYKHQKNEFNMSSRFDPILDQEAFHITLIDGSALDLSKADQKAIADDPTKSLRVGGSYYTISDVVGNLDGNPRTNDEPKDNGKMKFEMGMTPDGDRTSIIRIFDNGTARDGTGMVKPLGGTEGVGVARMKGIDMKYSWVHAADTVQRYVRHTWYGDESDWGTPADRGGQILPVELSFFRPALEDGKVIVRWTTESELDNAGFNILRSETRKGEYKQVNTELIQGAGTTGEKSSYNWVDPTAKPGVVYYYQIEDVSFAGEHQVLAITKLKGLISADGKLTTTWSELKQASQ